MRALSPNVSPRGCQSARGGGGFLVFTSGVSLKILDGLPAAIYDERASPRCNSWPLWSTIFKRLTRDIGVTDTTVKKLEFLGIRIIASRTESTPLTRPR